MGQLPEAKVKPAPAFNKVMLDLFGPYTEREVQKKTSSKGVWGNLHRFSHESGTR